MSREEQIKEAAVGRYGNEGNESQYMLGKIQAFIVGAKYADKTMLDKAIEWLNTNIPNHVINVSTENEFKIIIGSKTWNDFRKAMEE